MEPEVVALAFVPNWKICFADPALVGNRSVATTSAMKLSDLALLVVSSVYAAGCAAPAGDAGATGDEEAVSSGPPFTQAQADHSCRVVLRAAKVRFDEPPIFDRNGVPWYGVDVQVDVSDKSLHAGGSLVLQWGPGGTNPSFSRANNDPPAKVPGAPDGFQSFAFKLTHNTIEANGIDPRDLTGVDVALIPMVVFDHKTAFFDHNRVSAAGDQYALFLGQDDGASDGPLGTSFTIADDSNVCR
jgi:hypothetical protein